MGAVLHCLGDHGVDNDLFDLGDVVEGARLLQQTQDFTLSSRPSQRSALVVWRLASPLSQSLLDLGRSVAGRVVLVGHGEDVLGDCTLVCLVEARQSEGAGLEAS